MAESKLASEATSTCPICSRPTERDYRPFCSRRCADVDLARWLRGAYVIPDPAEDGEESKPPADGADGTVKDTSR